MLEPAEQLARLGQMKHQDYLREAAEIHRAAEAGGWGLRWHTAQLLLAVAGWLSPAHRALLQHQARHPLPSQASQG